MNHNSTTTSLAMDKIALAIDAIEKTIANHQGRTTAEHNEIILVLKWIVAPLIIIVGGLVGIKLAFPGL